MNTKEILRKPGDMTAAAPMAARAVALCEGCPTAKFCAVKTIAPCETPEVKTVRIEAGGGYEDSSLDKPIQTSYRKELFDPSQEFVMANLQKKKEIHLPASKPIPPRPAAVPAVVKPIARPSSVTPKRPAPSPVRKRPPVQERRPEATDILADILASMIGVSGIATARAKKSV